MEELTDLGTRILGRGRDRGRATGPIGLWGACCACFVRVNTRRQTGHVEAAAEWEEEDQAARLSSLDAADLRPATGSSAEVSRKSGTAGKVKQ
jgi:hypothetical protein